MTFEHVLACLKAGPRKDLRDVSLKTGISFGALRAIREGKTKFPRIDTVEKLRAYYGGTQ